VLKTHNRPYTSTDNPYSEAHFKTLKYRPEFPARFDSIEHARAFCRQFFSWYNAEHRHSGIGLMTPDAVTTDAPKRSTPTAPASLRPPTPRRANASSDARRDRPRCRPPPGSTSPTTNELLHTNFPTTPSHPA